MRAIQVILLVFLFWGGVIEPGLARSVCPAAATLPTGAEIISSVGYIAGIDDDARQIDLRRGGKALACFEVGTLLQAGDEIAVTGNRASIALHIHGQPKQMVLPDDRHSITIGSRPKRDALVDLIPEPIRRVFSPDKIVAILLMPRDVSEDPGPLSPDPIIPLVEQRLSPAVSRVEVHWLGKAHRVQLLFEGGTERTAPAPGNRAAVSFEPEERRSLRAIRVVGDGNSSIEWRVKAADAVPIAPVLWDRRETGDIQELLQVLWLLGLDASASEPGAQRAESAWRLEGLSRLAALAERSFAAEQILQAILVREIAPHTAD